MIFVLELAVVLNKDGLVRLSWVESNQVESAASKDTIEIHGLIKKIITNPRIKEELCNKCHVMNVLLTKNSIWMFNHVDSVQLSWVKEEPEKRCRIHRQNRNSRFQFQRKRKNWKKNFVEKTASNNWKLLLIELWHLIRQIYGIETDWIEETPEAVALLNHLNTRRDGGKKMAGYFLLLLRSKLWLINS